MSKKYALCLDHDYSLIKFSMHDVRASVEEALGDQLQSGIISAEEFNDAIDGALEREFKKDGLADRAQEITKLIKDALAKGHEVFITTLSLYPDSVLEWTLKKGYAALGLTEEEIGKIKILYTPMSISGEEVPGLAEQIVYVPCPGGGDPENKNHLLERAMQMAGVPQENVILYDDNEDNFIGAIDVGFAARLVKAEDVGGKSSWSAAINSTYELILELAKVSGEVPARFEDVGDSKLAAEPKVGEAQAEGVSSPDSALAQPSLGPSSEESGGGSSARAARQARWKMRRDLKKEKKGLDLVTQKAEISQQKAAEPSEKELAECWEGGFYSKVGHDFKPPSPPPSPKKDAGVPQEFEEQSTTLSRAQIKELVKGVNNDFSAEEGFKIFCFDHDDTLIKFNMHNLLARVEVKYLELCKNLGCVAQQEELHRLFDVVLERAFKRYGLADQAQKIVELIKCALADGRQVYITTDTCYPKYVRDWTLKKYYSELGLTPKEI